MKISVITVNYNNKDGLEKTVRSVTGQRGISLEYIVIDGGSTDGSKQVLEQYNDQITYWVSEKDAGIYNAMNKGIKKATGDYLFFMNSGDEYYSDQALAQLCPDSADADFVYGNVEYVFRHHSLVMKYPAELTFRFWYETTICHQGLLTHRRCFDEMGLYDEHYRIVSDWKFLILAFADKKYTFKKREVLVARFYSDGLSSDPVNGARLKQERRDVLEKEFGRFLPDYDEMTQLSKGLNRYRLLNPLYLAQRIYRSGHYRLKLFYNQKFGKSNF